MRLVLRFDEDAGDDAVDFEFTERGSGGPYPWLVKVGTLLLAARAGHLEGVGVGEAANVVVELDNRGKQAAAVIGHRLRTSASLYGDDEELLLAGVVQAIEYGQPLKLTIEG